MNTCTCIKFQNNAMVEWFWKYKHGEIVPLLVMEINGR